MVKVVYITNLLFSHYKNKYVTAYLYDLDSQYKLLSHNILVSYLLDQYYVKNQKQSKYLIMRLLIPKLLYK